MYLLCVILHETNCNCIYLFFGKLSYICFNVKFFIGNINNCNVMRRLQEYNQLQVYVYVELEDLKCDMAELNEILNTAVRQEIREVILTEINILSSKITSLNK